MNRALARDDHLPSAPAGARGRLKVLVADGQESLRQSLALYLESLGCQVSQVSSGAAAVEAVGREAFHLALCELDLEQEPGIDLLPRLLAARPGLDVVMLTGDVRLETAIEVVRRGGDYLEKPLSPAQIHRLVEDALDRVTAAACERERGPAPDPGPQPALLDPVSPRMKEARERLRDAAVHDLPVLLRGEAGTGKGCLARALHAESTRRDRPFVVVSCRAGPDELLASVAAADGGTAYLEDLAAVPLALQARLVRVLHERERASRGNARVVAASSRDLEAEVRAGRVRDDLLFRLHVTEIAVPPLRERVEDIVPLAQGFAASLARATGRPIPRLPLATRRMLVNWPWPGNVRELRAAIERALVRAPEAVLAPECLPPRLALRSGILPFPGGQHTVEELEREHATRVLAWAGSLSEAARILGVNKGTLGRKRKRWGVA